VNCSYWVSTGITPYLKKGIIVATSGHIGLDTWTSADGEARAAITQYVESIDPFFSKFFDQTTSSHKSSDKKKGKAQ
jgi:single-stranded DNA-binding protein